MKDSNTKTVYLIHPTTKMYVGTYDALPDPSNKGKYLVDGTYTTKEPPSSCSKWNGKDWENLENVESKNAAAKVKVAKKSGGKEKDGDGSDGEEGEGDGGGK